MGFPRPAVKSDYDAIVIGSGIAGLVCGSYLAMRGRRVLIAEKHYMVGGYCSSFRRKGFVFDAAVHHISGCGRLSIVGNCLRNLGIRLDFTYLNPMDTLVFPTWSVDIPSAIDEFKARLKQQFPNEAFGVDAFFTDLIKLYWAVLKDDARSAVLDGYQNLTMQGMLDRFFDDPKIKLALSGQWGYLGSPPNELSAVGMCQMLVNYWRDGAYYPAMGTQGFADAIAWKFIEYGGDLLVYHGVEKILVDNGRVWGVRLADGREVRAPVVVSNADPYQTFFNLLDDGIDPDYKEKIRRLKVSPSFFLLYLGLDRGGGLQRLKRGFYFRTEEMDSLWMYVSVPTQIEPRLAPPGKQIVTVVLSLRQEERSVQDWDRLREIKIKETLSWLEEFAPGLSRHVEILEAAVPPTLQKYTSNYRGAPYGWAVTPEQSGMRRLPHETPVDNLYLAGHWTIPGPGVCAVLASGWRTANRILNGKHPARGEHNGYGVTR